MRRIAFFGLLAGALALVAGPAQSQPQPGLPGITGGGQAENDNSGNPDFPDQVTQFGASARATAEGVETTHSFFDVPVTTYEATGMVQVRNTAADDRSTTVNSGHGEVVCIANFGPSSSVDGGGDPDADVWEIRVRFEVGTEDEPVAVYGSFLVQDNGREDYMDENFAMTRLASPDCGDAEFFELEPVTNGQLRVR